MDYYLPTTLKLVSVYRDLDAEPIQGANIMATKKEIEETLDTISHAFENLLDSFYEDTAMDVSTDISVLNTMLAQEGLTQRDFKKQP
jgi:5-bromo-4-chloroindolyl phosphate hydrolysis protein